MRIYYAWLHEWGVPTSINRNTLSEMDSPSYGSPHVNHSVTPGSVTTPHYQIKELYSLAGSESSYSASTNLVSRGNRSLTPHIPHHLDAFVAEIERVPAAMDQPDEGMMDVDEPRNLGVLPGPSSVSIRPADSVPLLHHRHAAGRRDHFNRISTQDASVHDRTDGDINNEAFDGADYVAIQGYTNSFPSSSLTSLAACHNPQVENTSQGNHGHPGHFHSVTIHQGDSRNSGEMSGILIAHRVSADSGYASKTTSMQSSGAEYLVQSRSVNDLGYGQSHGVNCREWTFQNNPLRGRSWLEEPSSFVTSMAPQQVYYALRNNLRSDSVRLWDEAGNTLLHKLAVMGAPWEYFETAFEAGVDPCHRNAYGQTFTHVLNVSRFHDNLIDCLTSLRRFGVDFSLRDASGWTILHCLYSQPISPQTAREILSLLEAPARQLSIRDVYGRSPYEIFQETYLQEASKHARWSTTELQLQMVGYFEDVISNGGVSRLSNESLDWPKIANNLDHSRITLQSQYKEVIDNARNGVDKEAVDGGNAFHAQAALLTAHDAATDLECLENFIAVGIDADHYDMAGRTPLEAIITLSREGETELTTSEKVSLLIDKGKANVHSRNRLGHTPVYSAAIRGRDRTVEVLLNQNSHVNIRANDGQSLLGAVKAAWNQALLDNGPGPSPYYETQCSRIEACKLLLERAGAVSDPTPDQALGYPEIKGPLPQ
jgi:ankyrin repeat protein